jgi:hypothetical protein
VEFVCGIIKTPKSGEEGNMSVGAKKLQQHKPHSVKASAVDLEEKKDIIQDASLSPKVLSSDEEVIHGPDHKLHLSHHFHKRIFPLTLDAPPAQWEGQPEIIVAEFTSKRASKLFNFSDFVLCRTGVKEY